MSETATFYLVLTANCVIMALGCFLLARNFHTMRLMIFILEGFREQMRLFGEAVDLTIKKEEEKNDAARNARNEPQRTHNSNVEPFRG